MCGALLSCIMGVICGSCKFIAEMACNFCYGGRSCLVQLCECAVVYTWLRKLKICCSETATTINEKLLCCHPHQHEDQEGMINQMELTGKGGHHAEEMATV